MSRFKVIGGCNEIGKSSSPSSSSSPSKTTDGQFGAQRFGTASSNILPNTPLNKSPAAIYVDKFLSGNEPLSIKIHNNIAPDFAKIKSNINNYT